MDHAEQYEAPRDWSALWTPGQTAKRKVVKSGDTRWEDTPDGRIRVISSPRQTDVRTTSVDVYEQEIMPGKRSAKHWHMADEIAYVLAGTGESEQWDVEAEIGERYQARVAIRPSRWHFSAGDLVYVPQNTVHRYSSDGSGPLRLLVAQNRLFKHLGYDAVVYLEDAAESERAMARSSAPSR